MASNQTAAAKKAAKKATAAAKVVDRSAVVAKTWKDKSVAAARAARDHVLVGKYEYRSVKAAFEDLGLPMGQHIKFRKELKAKGEAKFEGKTFRIVKKSSNGKH